jgi:hypothetical protein
MLGTFSQCSNSIFIPGPLVKNCHKLLYLQKKVSPRAIFTTVDRMQWRETCFVDRLSDTTAAACNDCDRSENLRASVQIKSSSRLEN